LLNHCLPSTRLSAVSGMVAVLWDLMNKFIPCQAILLTLTKFSQL
jgi:hypothetical protein